MLRYAESINQGLHRLFEADERVLLIGEDLLDPYGGAFKVAKGLSTKYPSRVLTTPISEAGFTGMGIGLAMRGFHPIVEIMFGDFLTLCVDQIVNNAAKFEWMYNHQVQVPLVIRTPMGGRRGYGPTHSQTAETLLMNTPLIRMISPSVFHDPGAMLFATVQKTTSPVIFIENKISYSQRLFEADNEDRSLERLTEGSNADYPTLRLSLDAQEIADVTVICYGGMAQIAAEAQKILAEKEEILVDVIIPSQIKPLPLEAILSCVERTGRAVIIEESPSPWGWGSELAAQIHAQLWRNLKAPCVRVGAKEYPIPSSGFMEQKALPQVQDVIAGVVESLEY